MRVISFDPGYERCGVAVTEKNNLGKEVVLFSHCIETTSTDEFSNRLHILGQAVENIVEKYNPTHIALETLFFNINKKTALNVAHARGVLMYIGSKHDLTVCEYSPSQIKIAVTGYGKSDKKQVISMVSKLVSISKKIQHDDEWDAIAVGITCLASERFTKE